jgi:hypothetical protein
MTTAAAQANKNAFIAFHLAGLAECENNMMPGYALYKDADRHDKQFADRALGGFRDGKACQHNPISPTETLDVSGAPTNVR